MSAVANNIKRRVLAFLCGRGFHTRPVGYSFGPHARDNGGCCARCGAGPL